MSKFNNKILVTCAFPYSNGPIHLGHMLEHIQADIWVRYHRMRNREIYFICADDAHGTPVMLKSKELMISPEEMINNVHEEHKRDFYDFYISYDHYSSTHILENKFLLEKIFFNLKINKYIKKKNIFQFYDVKKNMFLPDRFIKGSCPKCFSPNQYGDHCEICGSTYNSCELINPFSIISNSPPQLKKTEHFFFNLPKFEKILKEWVNSGVLQKKILNKIKEWFSIGLKDWDITRDSPYFGFQIPYYSDKYFYVWLDASVGYISVFKNFCKKKKNINFNDFWKKNSNTELYHFIGKDIIYFHSLFWPALLESINYRKPNNIFVHGYLTINGKKMSKSKGTFITARSYLKYLDSDSLRYYYASKLSSNADDINFNLNELVNCINKNIVNKIVNLASRNAVFINKFFKDRLSNVIHNICLYEKFVDYSYKIAENFDKLEYSKVIKKILYLTDLANSYIDYQAPWVLFNKKDFKNTHSICSTGINLFRILMTYLKPIMPKLSKKVEFFLNISLNWNEIKNPLLDHKISKFEILFKRIKIEDVNPIFLYKKIE